MNCDANSTKLLPAAAAVGWSELVAAAAVEPVEGEEAELWWWSAGALIAGPAEAEEVGPSPQAADVQWCSV